MVEPQHGHIAERVSPQLVVAPVLHPRGGQLRMLGQRPGQAAEVAAVEDVAALHLQLEPGPAGEPVLAGQRQLRRGENEPVRDRADPRDRAGVAAVGGAQQVLGLVAELAEVGPGRQVRHDVSLVTRWSAAGLAESVISNGLLLARGGGLCPARGPSGALQHLALIVSARAPPVTQRRRSPGPSRSPQACPGTFLPRSAALASTQEASQLTAVAVLKPGELLRPCSVLPCRARNRRAEGEPLVLGERTDRAGQALVPRPSRIGGEWRGEECGVFA